MYRVTNPRIQRGLRRGLGQLPGIDLATPVALAASSPSTDASGCWWNYLLGKTSYDACVTSANQAQIQQVANNANVYYPGPTAALAQQVATQQEALVPGDVQNADTLYNLPASPFLPSLGPGFNPSDPSTWPLWLWIAIAAGGGLVLISALKR